MSLAAVLLILIAIAVAEAVLALDSPGRRVELTLMAAILLIAVALVLLDVSSAGLAIDAPVG